MYESKRIRRFCAWYEAAGVSWAILSAEYALFFPNEQRDDYDTTLRFRRGQLHVYRRERRLSPPESEAHVQHLIEAVRARLGGLGFDRVQFYVEGRRPIAYLLVMHRALDGCVRGHRSADEVLKCIETAGRVHLVSGRAGLSASLALHQPNRSQAGNDASDAAPLPTQTERAPGRAPGKTGFEAALAEVFTEAESAGKPYVDVEAGELHCRVGGYPGQNHRMPVCCGVMRKAMRPGDKVLPGGPPKGSGPKLTIRYLLPRK